MASSRHSDEDWVVRPEDCQVPGKDPANQPAAVKIDFHFPTPDQFPSSGDDALAPPRSWLERYVDNFFEGSRGSRPPLSSSDDSSSSKNSAEHRDDGLPPSSGPGVPTSAADAIAEDFQRLFGDIFRPSADEPPGLRYRRIDPETTRSSRQKHSVGFYHDRCWYTKLEEVVDGQPKPPAVFRRCMRQPKEIMVEGDYRKPTSSSNRWEVYDPARHDSE